jgi:hypothetical protein
MQSARAPQLRRAFDESHRLDRHWFRDAVRIDAPVAAPAAERQPLGYDLRQLQIFADSREWSTAPTSGLHIALPPLQRSCGCDSAPPSSSSTSTALEDLFRRKSDQRCDMEADCPEIQEDVPVDDPVDYQGSGTTTCDMASGTMNTALTEHCGGDCVAQHEAVHRTDRSPCCSRVKLCLDNAGGDAARQQACRDAYVAWHPRLSHWTECNAYTREVTCLSDFISNNCRSSADGGAPTVTPDCCDTLGRELTFASSQKATHCGSAVNAPCPFKPDGTL